jgi:hypothetical protein
MPGKAALLLALAALLFAPAVANAALPALYAQPDALNGGRIVDATGREVLLRGAELTGHVNRRVLQATGWNVVRVRLDARAIADAERLVDALAEDGIYSVLVLPELPVGLRTLDPIVARFATRPHVIGFEGYPASGKLLFNPLGASTTGLVYAPPAASTDALEAVRRSSAGAPVVVSWRPSADVGRFQDAVNGLRLGAIATVAGAIDPRGPLARAYVRAAPGRLEFSHYEEARGHFAARGVASGANQAPIEIFYPGAKHREARFRVRGVYGLRAARTPGGGRLVTGVPRGKWSIQIGPRLT